MLFDVTTFACNKKDGATDKQAVNLFFSAALTKVKDPPCVSPSIAKRPRATKIFVTRVFQDTFWMSYFPG